jgi:hypothetical protein
MYLLDDNKFCPIIIITDLQHVQFCNVSINEQKLDEKFQQIVLAIEDVTKEDEQVENGEIKNGIVRVANDFLVFSFVIILTTIIFIVPREFFYGLNIRFSSTQASPF